MQGEYYNREQLLKEIADITAQRKKAKNLSCGNSQLYKLLSMQYFLESRRGNCSELAQLAVAFLCYLNFKGFLSVCVGVKNPVIPDTKLDHVFILLTDDYQHLPRFATFHTLPPSVLILDPWLNVYFSADKALDYFKRIAYFYKWGVAEKLMFHVPALQSVTDYKTNDENFIFNTLLSHQFKVALQEIKQQYPEAQISEQLNYNALINNNTYNNSLS